MPDKRKQGKKRIGFWVSPGEAQTLKGIAEEEGLNTTDAFRHIMAWYVMNKMAQARKEKEIKK